ncbi:MAG TPA: hypothetical protein VN455_05920 [Methanotrichaceae archaeon]|nr:hypothetical protein [Methanotrichaceae archaeon]
MANEKRADRKEDAARAISPEALIEAKSAIIIDCREYIRWSEVLSLSLDGKVNTLEEARRFAKVLALYQLGYLPVKPGTCPFCIQYSADRSCIGCGYASTHGGRCDLDSSAFNQFIEAFQELGRIIYQDNSEPCFDIEGIDPECFDIEAAIQELRRSIDGSSQAAGRLVADLTDASALRLMEIKAAYLETMLGLMPECLLSVDARVALDRVREALKRYW